MILKKGRRKYKIASVTVVSEFGKENVKCKCQQYLVALEMRKNKIVSVSGFQKGNVKM